MVGIVLTKESHMRRLNVISQKHVHVTQMVEPMLNSFTTDGQTSKQTDSQGYNYTPLITDSGCITMLKIILFHYLK